MDFKKMSVTELKALAYDISTVIERSQYNLRLVNQEIASRSDAKKAPAGDSTEKTKK